MISVVVPFVQLQDMIGMTIQLTGQMNAGLL